jgi:Ser/Thr protein kinase RdoA (MazF antagonist)
MTNAPEIQGTVRAQPEVPPAVAEAFGIAPDSAQRIATGLINRSWRVCTVEGVPGVLQRVNALFDENVQLDIHAVTAHLAERGITTPLLVATRMGDLFVRDDAGALWRLLTYIEGVSHEQLATAHQARSAGRVLARFHAAVANYTGPLRSTRPNVHHLPRHLESLTRAVATHGEHPRFASIEALAEQIWQTAAMLPDYPLGPTRLVHGDPKISNIMFERDTDRAICLVDLDTVTRMPVVYELADAFRSWCNPEREDSPRAEFSLELFAAACEGYAEFAEPDVRASWRSLAPATATIAIELAARFCADALNERYFAWDPARFASASAHNEARARSQLAVARLVLARARALEDAAAAAFV